MSDDEINKIIEQMTKEFGDKLPNPEVFPQSFTYYYKLHKYYKECNHEQKPEV